MATTPRDFYSVIGVSRNASQDDIKKAYRKLARQYHPDLHSGSKKTQMEQKFKELNQAHEVLGNEETRKKYDRYGHQWEQAEAYEKARREAGYGRGRGPEGSFEQFEGGPDFSSIFERFFSGGGGGDTHTRTRSGGVGHPGEDLETTVRLSAREILTGVSRRVELSEPITCTSCRGTGRQRGRTCPGCAGMGSRTESRVIDVKIPSGVEDGTRVRVAGKGGLGFNGGKRGDMFLNVQLFDDGVFRPQGSDVHVTLPVWPWEAALGAEVMAPTLNSPVRVKIPPGSRAEEKLRLKGKGLPNRSGRRGDLLLTLQIVMPTPLTEEDRKLFEQLGRVSRQDPRADLLRQASHS